MRSPQPETLILSHWQGTNNQERSTPWGLTAETQSVGSRACQFCRAPSSTASSPSPALAPMLWLWQGLLLPDQVAMCWLVHTGACPLCVPITPRPSAIPPSLQPSATHTMPPMSTPILAHTAPRLFHSPPDWLHKACVMTPHGTRQPGRATTHHRCSKLYLGLCPKMHPAASSRQPASGWHSEATWASPPLSSWSPLPPAWVNKEKVAFLSWAGKEIGSTWAWTYKAEKTLSSPVLGRGRCHPQRVSTGLQTMDLEL